MLDNLFGVAIPEAAFSLRILAFTALSMVPAPGFFVLAERRIVAGLSGSLKG
jgi:raffinose/stachyose/melibiose transport system permease protein